jgi:methionyl aminopeptidase
MIIIKTKKEIDIMKEGGMILSRILKELSQKVKPGIYTQELEEEAVRLIKKERAECNFKGYNGYPNCLCVSVNDEIVHCRPSKVLLKDGDIVSLDLGILWKGFHHDMAITVPVGFVSEEAKKLIDVTREALIIGIKKVKVGLDFEELGYAIQKYVEKNGFNVVRELCGHGIGRDLHEEPQVFNYRVKGYNLRMEEGMVFCIEPMVTTGDWRIKKKDDYCYVTRDGSLSAHFEAMVAVSKQGAVLLTPLLT